MCLGNVFILLILIPINHLILALIAEEFSLDVNDLADGDTDILNNQAYVQTGSELYYFKDISYQDSVILPISTEFNKEINSDAKQKIQKNVQIFDQEITDFGTTVFGIPVQKMVNVNNPSNSDVIFEAIFTIGTNFHCTFLENKTLSSNQRSSFRVYFLPLAEDAGIKEELIVLQTSIGKFIHKVRGEVIGNPYRIRSILGVNIPLNATMSAPLQLHNPHTAYMRILEIYTNDCHLQMETFGNNNIMDVPDLLFEPFETKEIAFAKILGDTERNSTTFIFIKFRLEYKNYERKIFTWNRDQTSYTLIVPLEVRVTRRRGLFSTTHILDFNLLRAGDQAKPLKLNVFSTLERGIEIESVNVDKPKGVYLQFEQRPPIPIKPANRGQPSTSMDIASINVDTNLESKEIGEEKLEDFEKLIKREGFVVAESRGGNYNVTVPFKAIIYKGALLHNPDEVSFHKAQLPILSKIVTLSNTLPYGLIIHSVDVAKNAKNYFKTSLISSSITLSSGQSLPVFVLHFIKRVAADFASNIFIHTNLTTFQIPLYIFQGDLKVKVHSLEKDRFQFGAIKYGEKRSIHFTLSNSNPVPLIIDKFHPPFKELSIESINIEKLSKTNEKGLISKWKKKKKSKLYLPEYSSATFKMILSFDSNSKQISFFNGNGNETFQITTQFSTYQFPIFFKLINSSTFLTIPNKIIFEDAFIGNILTQPLMILSKFPNELRVLRITINEEPRFSLNVSNKSLIIQPNISTNLAKITFAPEAICPQDCYLGIPLTTTDGQWFAYGMKLPQNLAEIDSYLYSRLRRKWVQMKEKIAKTTISLDADKIRGLEVPIEAHLTWPRLFSHPVVHFPLTAVGNFSIVNLTITNPSRFSVIVQILPIVIYPDAESLIELIHDELPAPLIDPIEVNETLMFSLRDTELFTLKPTSPVPKLREEVEKLVEGPLPRFTLSLLLRPGSSTRVRIGFLPSDYSLRSSLLVIRNNFTALEPIVLYGRGARINMEIDNKTARSQPLFFELESVHLTDCTNPRRQLHRMPTTLTVRRSFAIRNTGEVGFSVQNISINGMPCQNRGYRILNCDRFRLEPNETTYLDLAFTPDFLFSVSEATLQIYIHMNGTPWNFEMASIVPKHLLSLCHNALPRPPFEAVIYQTCVLALIFCLICVISCAYLEGDRVVMNALREQFLQEQECEVFDLNAPELKMQNRNIEKISISIQKRDFLQVSEEDGTLKKLFWRIMNFILRIFSHIWPLLHSNQKQSTKSNCPQKHSQNSIQSKNISNNNADEQLMDQSNINGIISDSKKHNNSIGTTFTSANSTTSIFWTTKKSQIIYDLNQNSLNDDSVSSSTISDDVYARSSEQQQHLILNGKRQRRKKKLDAEIDSTKNVPLFMRNNSINKQNQFVPTTESNQNGIKLTTNIKDNLTKFERKNEKRAGKPTNNSIETTLPFNISSSSELVPSLISSSGTQLNGNTNSIQKSSDDEIYNHVSVMSRSSNSDADEKISWHNSNSLNDIEEDNYNERKELSDESDVPEWADEMIEKGNLDDEFDALAKNSAALFDDTINVNINEAMTKMENKEIVNEGSEIDRVITQLTQEYRERLTKILKCKTFDDIFTLPPDLTPNIEEYFENYLERKTFITSKVHPKSTTHKKPPGHELPKMERKKQHNERQPVFLFNIYDPVWKPIGLFDDNLKEDWPDSHVKLNKSLPNNLNYNNE